MTKGRNTIVSYERDFPELEDRDAAERPTEYLRKAEGSEDFEVVDGRRPSRMLLVNKLREAVDAWRAADYPDASATTYELFQHWFSGAAATSGEPFALYWGQREAVETLAYLIEVKGVQDVQQLIAGYAEIRRTTLLPEGIIFETDMDGNRFARVPTEKSAESIRLPPEDLQRFACKMATGSGKTLVMALVIVWSYFHARREPHSPLSTNFLVLAPNVIVFERLRVDFENGRVFRDLPLIPPGWKFDLHVILRGEASEPGGAGNLFVTNIQQIYEGRGDWTPSNAIDALLGRKPTGNAATQGRSMLDRVRSLGRLLVLNDEAHHVHDDELQWNQTLVTLHQALPHGLAAWLDFSATPRFQAGAHFPWIVCDYPLAQAVEDRIVKAPVILHLVDKPEPDQVTGQNVIEKYGDWIAAGVKRLTDHTQAYKDIPDTKPVMFVMCETIRHADLIGAWLTDKSSPFKLNDDEVLIIHTDKEGEIKKGDLDELRKRAREIDDPANPVKVVVSVLVLREGWDVRNVTVVLGLRPGTAAAKILPEQAVGRGLRLMKQVGPEKRQVLEVLGTPAFENFVRELEAEGVYIPTTTRAPPPPIRIYPVKDRVKFDITIPKTSAGLEHVYRRLDAFDPSKVEALFKTTDAANRYDLRIAVEDATYGFNLGGLAIERPGGPLASEVVAMIVNKTQAAARLTSEFATLYPLIEAYLARRCFGGLIDLEDENVRRFLGSPVNADRVAALLGRKLGELLVEARPLALQVSPIRLSQTATFLWRRQHEPMAMTIFNEVATFNPFETSFGGFLAECKDVRRFAALAEHFTGFWVDYLKPSGAIGRYFPDWVVVQKTSIGEVNWIVETKGRVWDGTEQKDAAIRYWCTQVTDLAGEPWRYMRVDQPIFKPERLTRFVDLVELIVQRNEAIEDQVLFSPAGAP
jgi:type III restriction enzyme